MFGILLLLLISRGAAGVKGDTMLLMKNGTRGWLITCVSVYPTRAPLCVKRLRENDGHRLVLVAGCNRLLYSVTSFTSQIRASHLMSI